MPTNKILKQFIQKTKSLSSLDQNSLEKLKREFASKYGSGIIPNAQLLAVYHSLVKTKKISANKNLENLLRKRRIRTLSGVAVIAIFTKPYKCPGTCLYCPTQKNIPKSYLDNEPAVMRAVLCNYNPEKQIWVRLKTLKNLGHPTDKIELIIMGGTFSALPKSYQLSFINRCFKACNKARFKISNSQFSISNKISNSKLQNLKIEQRKNEKEKHRIVGLTLETRPDFINEKEIKWMRQLGATRVELGVQSIYDDVLKFNQRGHLVEKTIEATRLLKDAGFKINYHIMPNLPKSNPSRDLEMFKELFTNPNFQPDMLKIYPCVLTKEAEKLKNLWKKGKYKPYSTKQLINLLIKIKQIIPPYVRIMRLIRDIPATDILAGNKISNLREVVQKEMKQKNLKCRCIRCREIKKLVPKNKHLKMVRIDYPASGGKEIFLSFEDKKNDKLIAFLRLRIPSQYFENKKHFLPELNDAALIREIHTYGQMVPISKKQKEVSQHKGLGKKLVLEAEKIVQKEFGIKKMAVIAGVGVRDYWRKLNYRLQKTYMIKRLT